MRTEFCEEEIFIWIIYIIILNLYLEYESKIKYFFIIRDIYFYVVFIKNMEFDVEGIVGFVIVVFYEILVKIVSDLIKWI